MAVWDKGFNFRSTLGYVTDGASEQFVFSDNSQPAATHFYPKTTTIGGDSVTWGWTSTANTLRSFDQNSSFDRRLAGNAQQSNDGSRSEFRIDLPQAGTYTLTLAAGDAQFSQPNLNIEFLDNLTTLLILNWPTTTNAGSYRDAKGNVLSAANWPSGNVTEQLIFTTAICRFRIGTPSGAPGSACLNHVRLFIDTGGSTPPPGPPATPRWRREVLEV